MATNYYPALYNGQQLNAYQQHTKEMLDQLAASTPNTLQSDNSMFDPNNPNWMGADLQYRALSEDYENSPTEKARQALDKRIAELNAMKASGNGQQQALDQNYNEQLKQAQNAFQYALEHPDGGDDFMTKFMGTAMPLAVGGFMGAGALGMLGSGGATAAATGGAATGGAGVGTGAASGALGGASSGLGGALSSGWAGLPGFAQTALTNMGVNGAVNLVTGRPLTSGMLQAGLTAGLGSLATPFVGNVVGNGLANLGFSPETVASLVRPVTTGMIGAGTGLIRGQNLGNALLNGIQSGTISFAGDKLNGFIKGQGFSAPVSNVLSGAGKGAIGSVIKGKNPLAGIVSGATSGAFNYGTGLLTGPSNQPSPPVHTMSDGTDDYFSMDGTDYLSQIESDYSDPYNFRNDDFYNYGGDNYEPYTMNDSYADAFPDLYNYQASNPDTGNSALDSFLKNLGGGLGNAVGNAVGGNGGSGGTKNSFIDNLMKQLGNAGTSASNNPLAAIAAAIGAYGSLKGSMKGPDFSAVDNLMAKGNAQMNSPAFLPMGNITARDPRFFTQQYDANNQPIKNNLPAPAGPSAPSGPDYHTQLDTLYQSVLGRAPDSAGEQFWAGQLKNGMSLAEVMQQMQNSAEAKGPKAVMTGALSKVQP